MGLSAEIATGATRPSGHFVHRLARRFRGDSRGATMVEMAFVLPVFLTFLFVLFEIAYGQLLQSTLESTLQITAYQVQTGQTENTTSGAAFIDNNLCANSITTVLGCHNIYVRIQQFEPTACTDFYDATTGDLPVTAGVLQLGDYVGDNGVNGANTGTVGPTNCENSAGPSGGTGFCNAGPNEYIIMSAVYVAPTFLYALFPRESYTYGGNYVHAAFATTAFYTEGFTAPTTPIIPC